MKKIQLTQCKEAIVDDSFKDTNKWHANKMGNSFYAKRDRTINGKREVIHMHRMIMEQKLNRKLKPNEHIDHINRNGLDNRECNLRLCIRSENCQNSKIKISNTSGFKGIHKSHNKWIARIGYQGKRHYLGMFTSKISAAISYDKKAMEIYGPFAQLNILMVG